MNTVTTDVLTRLKEAYCIAVKEGRITFDFEGKELVTDFVKVMKTQKEILLKHSKGNMYTDEYILNAMQEYSDQQNAELKEILKDIYLHHLPNHTEGNPLIKRLEALLK
jgi:hypothetical protein